MLSIRMIHAFQKTIYRTIYVVALFAVFLPVVPATQQPSVARSAKSQSIRLHPANPHYFLFRGKAVVLITSGEHYGAVLNRDFDHHRYLSTLEADELNYTRLFTGSYVEVPAKSFGILHNDLAPEPGRFLAPWARSDTPGYAGGENKFDLDRWDPEFFTRFRDFLSKAAERGIVVEVTLFSSHYDEAQWQMSALNPANNINDIKAIDWKKLHTLENGNILAYQEKYARKLVREANSFDNVIFEIQNEPWSDRPVLAGVINPYLRPPARDNFPNSIDLPDELSMAWQARVAEWITQEESALPNHHLIAQNYSNFCLPVRKILPGVGVVNFHYAYPDAVLLNYGLQFPMTKQVFSAATMTPTGARRGISSFPAEAFLTASTIPLPPATKTAPTPRPMVPAAEAPLFAVSFEFSATFCSRSLWLIFAQIPAQ